MSYEEDIENQINEHFHRLHEEEIENTVENYLHYLESSHDVKKKTLEEKTSEIYSAILLVYEYLDSGSSYSMIGYETLDNVLFDVTEDIEMSIFLSIHGKYRAANALLRRWLETAITAIYFDCELKKQFNDVENYEKTLAEGWVWLEKSKHIPFAGKNAVLDKLIDSNTDDFALQLLSENAYFEDSTFNKYVKNIYGNLSKSVHYGGMNRSLDNLCIDFSEYNRELFEKWYGNFNQVNEICNILIFLKNPETITLIKEHKISIPTLKNNQMIILKRILKSKA